jgi:3-hydroxyisobutyrate dehydrogenase-like beta-hydroxyacid dehydrogenase
MAKTIAKAGYPVVVWNRDRSKADGVAAEIGGERAETPAEAASRSDVVITSLADDAAVRAVYLDPDGVRDGLRPNSIAIDTSTVDPQTVIEVGESLDETGAAFFDCPVSGSVSTVEAGALTIMVGGDFQQLGRAEAVLDTLASRLIHVGDRGAGAATKLAVNCLVHGLNIALSEALVLAESAGVDRRTAYEVFASGAGGAPFVQYKRDAYENPDEASVAFSLDLVAKDLELITELGRKVGAPMAQAQTGLEIVERAIESGMGADDLSAVAVYLRKNTQVGQDKQQGAANG